MLARLLSLPRLLVFPRTIRVVGGFYDGKWATVHGTSLSKFIQGKGEGLIVHLR